MIREREGWGQGAFVSVMETSACKRLLSDEIFAELCGSAVSAAGPSEASLCAGQGGSRGSLLRTEGPPLRQPCLVTPRMLKPTNTNTPRRGASYTLEALWAASRSALITTFYCFDG